ncbi:MAG: N-acetyl-gamma-glutamyl-phosphate reductase [Planctomycetota bacterium]|nr:N-acetyl-gamma-glutamyl-phosphate reductase [Planctomycetota bacterium]
MIRVCILGGTGYTALELIKLLLRHPQVQIVALTSRQEGNKHVSTVHPSLAGRLDLNLEDLSPAQIAERADLVFSCLPHGVTAELVPELLNAGVRVVDFSADYRLDDAQTYEAWYALKHPDPIRLGQVVYGLPELFREKIPPAQLVANPGCYTTTSILALAPLVKAGLIDPHDIIIDAKSGVSGAGRVPKLNTLYPECNESISAYGVGNHRHTPEIEQVVGRVTGKKLSVIFTPHLVPMDRGILCTIYANPVGSVSDATVTEALQDFYRNEPFVKIVSHLPASKDTSGTNYCHISARVVRGKVLLFSSLDNLIKGASGAAVQNFNLMYGFEETTALI